MNPTTIANQAIEAGYETDAEVPEDLVREWLGLPKKGGELT